MYLKFLKGMDDFVFPKFAKPIVRAEQTQPGSRADNRQKVRELNRKKPINYRVECSDEQGV
jgi:hypothetical protein